MKQKTQDAFSGLSKEEATYKSDKLKAAEEIVRLKEHIATLEVRRKNLWL